MLRPKTTHEPPTSGEINGIDLLNRFVADLLTWTPFAVLRHTSWLGQARPGPW